MWGSPDREFGVGATLISAILIVVVLIVAHYLRKQIQSDRQKREDECGRAEEAQKEMWQGELRIETEEDIYEENKME